MGGLSVGKLAVNFQLNLNFVISIQNWVISKRLEIPSLDFSGMVCDPDLTQNLSPDMQ